ncbi:MAG TPA: acyltransferase domain-containing protein, partial [Verrucomicrobiae bacterium]|nr:acyltransferase domain-containing protein [Verrucomicrobiae bacterium]
NCHIVVEGIVCPGAQLLPLSGIDENDLHAKAKELQAELKSSAIPLALQRACATAAERCGSEPARAAFTANSPAALGAQIEGFLAGQRRPGLATGTVNSGRPKLAFVFSPQGSQWLGMGRSLMLSEPVFRSKLSECASALKGFGGWSLFDELMQPGERSRLDRAEFVQPALFSIQVALAALWQSWGIQPDFITAHSLGEWAAAHVAGGLTLEEAMRVVVESSRAQAAAGEGGGMAVVELPAEALAQRLACLAGDVCIAGFNSPTSTILSGDAGQLRALVAQWKQQGVTCSLIDVDVAAHSPRMEPILAGLQASLTGIEPTRVAVPFVSSTTGDFLAGPEMGPAHWARHLREPVRFRECVERLARAGCTAFLEVSPHPLLVGGIRQTLKERGLEGFALGSCRRGDDERGSLLDGVGRLYVRGWPVDWPAVLAPNSVDLRTNGDSAPLSRPAPGPALLLPLSAHTSQALSERARSLSCQLRPLARIGVEAVVHTATARRMHLEHRLATVGSSADEIASALAAFAEGKRTASVVAGRVPANGLPKIAFICSGQG